MVAGPPSSAPLIPIGAQASWEVTSFASGATANEFKQPVWYRFIRLEGGRIEEVKYVDSFLPHPHPGTHLAERYYEELLRPLSIGIVSLMAG